MGVKTLATPLDRGVFCVEDISLQGVFYTRCHQVDHTRKHMGQMILEYSHYTHSGSRFMALVQLILLILSREPSSKTNKQKN